MKFSREEILTHFDIWLCAWDDHDLEGVMKLMHEDVIFENWNGSIVFGRNALKKSWTAWFTHHGDFRFIKEDIFIDEEEQKMTFQWRLEWPSLELQFKGRPERRRGVDLLHFLDGKIIRKYTYSKTIVQIDSSLAQENELKK
jgi:hypothetical protein